jgi:hypothetical protein
MTNEQKKLLKAAIEANPHLYSARHNKDYLTMAIEINQGLKPEDHVTEIEVHEAMLFVDEAPSE